MQDAPPPVLLGLLQRRLTLRPTWRGWAVLLLAGMALLVMAVRGMYPFLAVNDPRPGGVLVVEGWVPDFAIVEAMAEVRRNPYELLVVSGGPMEKGAPFSEFGSFAEFGTATAVKLGFDAAKVRAVPSPPARQDRTYLSAVAVREWLRQRGPMPARVNVVSLGPHARRSRLLYEKAFDGLAEIGVTAINEQAYDGRVWWTTSHGVRAVIGELIAYGYARLIFRTPR